MGYDQAREYVRQFAHEEKQEDPIPDNWQEYLDKYDFNKSDICQAMAKCLQSPQRAHPTWFKLAEIAVRQSGQTLDDLTYEKIVDAIAAADL